MVLNNVTKFYKILILESGQFQMVNFHKQRAIAPEGMVRYGPLLNLMKGHKITWLRERTLLGVTYVRTARRNT